MATRKRLYPGALATVRKQLEAPVQKGAEAYAAALKTNVSRGARSGAAIPGKSFSRSSAREYPQEVEGDLVGSVDANPTNNPLVWQGGFFGQPQGKLDALEFGRNDGSMAPRAPLQRTADDPDTHREMLTAAQKAGKGR